MQTSKSSRSERGSVVVEASFSLILFYTLIFGLVTFGYALYIEQTLTHGVRDAVRYGVVHAYEDDAQLMQEVRNLALCGNAATCGGAFGLTTANITVTCSAPAAPAGQTCRYADRMVVTLAAHGLTSFTPGLAGLSGRAITASLTIENADAAIN